MTKFGTTTRVGAIEAGAQCSTLSYALDALDESLSQAIRTQADLEAESFDDSSNPTGLDGMIALSERKWQAVDAVLAKLDAMDPKRPEETAILRVASLVDTLRCFEDDLQGAQVFGASLKNRDWLRLHAAQSTLSTVVVNAQCKTTLDLFEDMSMLGLPSSTARYVSD